MIGKGGAHASAIRTILAAASGKENKRYILEIIEDLIAVSLSQASRALRSWRAVRPKNAHLSAALADK